jgi:hypothetical protein
MSLIFKNSFSIHKFHSSGMAFKHKYFMVGEIDKVMNIFVVIGLQHSM